MEPWVSSLCATLSQKGGLEVICALLSLRAPWQHSHLDINTHQKRAQAHTRNQGLRAWGQIPPGSKDVRRSPGHDGVPASPLQGQIWHPPYNTPMILIILWHPIPNAGDLSSLWIAKYFTVEAFFTFFTIKLRAELSFLSLFF